MSEINKIRDKQPKPDIPKPITDDDVKKVRQENEERKSLADSPQNSQKDKKIEEDNASTNEIYSKEIHTFQNNIEQNNTDSQISKTKESTLMKKGGFSDIDDWNNARNEGFDSKEDWDEWQEIKKTGFTDIDLFYESKNIRFYQKSLRKAFLKELKLASKGGFSSYQEWNEAKKWDISDFQDWEIIKKFNFNSKEEFLLFRKFKSKIEFYLAELLPNQETTVSKIIEIICQDLNVNLQSFGSTAIIYNGFTKERFETILRNAISDISIESDYFKYSRLKDTIIRVSSTSSLDIFSRKANQDIKCPKCNNYLSKTVTFCPECGQKIDKCPICKIALLTDATGSCPKCEGEFHLNHLKEVLKISGKCPICNFRMQEFEIVLKNQ